MLAGLVGELSERHTQTLLVLIFLQHSCRINDRVRTLAFSLIKRLKTWSQKHLINAGKTMKNVGACRVGRSVKLRGVVKHNLSSYFCSILAD